MYADRTGEAFAFYPDVPAILQTAQRAGLRLGLASRTHAPEIANELLRLLHVPGAGPAGGAGGAKKAMDFFPPKHRQIFPSDKKVHLQKLKRECGVAGDDILFFDDETRNRNVESLGVTFWLVEDGVTADEVDRGVREWRRRRGGGESSSGVSI